MSDRQKSGALGEKIAREHLIGLGYQVRETNFRCREGEIDIIAEKEGCLIFVEVRTKASSSFGTPEESITASKGKRLISVANTYLETHSDLPPSWRIDVVAVELGHRGKIVRVEVIENAVTGEA